MSEHDNPHRVHRLLTVVMQTRRIYINTCVLRHWYNNLLSGLQVRGDKRGVLRRSLRNRCHLNHDVHFVSAGTTLMGDEKRTGGNSRRVS